MSSFIFSSVMNLSRRIWNNHLHNGSATLGGADTEGASEIGHSLANSPESRTHHPGVRVVQGSRIEPLAVIFHSDSNFLVSEMNADDQLRCLRVANRVAYDFLTASIKCNIDAFPQRMRLAARAAFHTHGRVTRNLMSKFLHSRREAECVQNARIKRV